MLQFSEEFFKGETKEGFYVDETMKRVWAAEMELLQEIIDICDRYGLTYYADWGTLLGTVRHKGFIPWDDDMDIAMKRADFQKLLGVLPKELPKGYLVLEPTLRDDYENYMLRVVNSHEVSFAPERMEKFHGCPFVIGIDIFPLDCIPRDEEAAAAMDSLMTLIITGVIYDHTAESREPILCTLEDALNVKFKRDKTIVNQLLRLGSQLSMSFREEEGDYLTCYPLYVKANHFKVKKEWYQETIPMPFETMTLNVPVGYDGVLRSMYGDYMVPRKASAGHNYPFYKTQLEDIREKLQEMEEREKKEC